MTMALLLDASIAFLLLLGAAADDPGLFDVALILALLAAFATFAFVKALSAPDDATPPRGGQA